MIKNYKETERDIVSNTNLSVGVGDSIVMLKDNLVFRRDT